MDYLNLEQMLNSSSNKKWNLAGRVALVTGASRGIGAAIAKGLGEAGAAVCVNYADSERAAAEVVNDIRAMGSKAEAVQANLGELDSSRRLYEGCVQALGAPDILVSNVAIQHASPWEKITREQVIHQMQVNFQSALELMQPAAPAMKEKQWGRILTIGSVQEAKPHPDMLVYSSLKNAQTAMVQSLARQLAPYGITVNNLAPGVILTDRSKENLTDKEYEKKVLAAIPARRFGESEDCVGAALLLCSNAGAYITGQSLYVDGGMSL